MKNEDTEEKGLMMAAGITLNGPTEEEQEEEAWHNTNSNKNPFIK